MSEDKIVLELTESQFADVQSALSFTSRKHRESAPLFSADTAKLLKKTWSVLRKHRAAQKKKTKK